MMMNDTGVKVKVCGIRDMRSALAAAEGADFLGFIMCSRFWRYVEPDLVREICQMVPRSRKVGVFVDQPLDEVSRLADYCGLDFVQLHGHETEEYAGRLQAGGYSIIKAFRYGEDFSPERADRYPADLILIDSYSKNTEGGSGISFAWQSAAAEIKKVKKPYIIAGGIGIENVREAMDIFQPYGIDASSSMEIDRKKSPRLIREFLKEAGKL
ncbi:phosphoribosylanthranilate isomerase [Anaerovibrio sp.]|uniref:phosphoribosylanthranilate isomerase n=1 Tax=Anaerovibrio sp. TaxID=1872532 RepID=UPI003F151CD5